MARRPRHAKKKPPVTPPKPKDIVRNATNTAVFCAPPQGMAVNLPVDNEGHTDRNFDLIELGHQIFLTHKGEPFVDITSPKYIPHMQEKEAEMGTTYNLLHDKLAYYFKRYAIQQKMLNLPETKKHSIESLIRSLPYSAAFQQTGAYRCAEASTNSMLKMIYFLHKNRAFLTRKAMPSFITLTLEYSTNLAALAQANIPPPAHAHQNHHFVLVIPRGNTKKVEKIRQLCRYNKQEHRCDWQNPIQDPSTVINTLRKTKPTICDPWADSHTKLVGTDGFHKSLFNHPRLIHAIQVVDGQYLLDEDTARLLDTFFYSNTTEWDGFIANDQAAETDLYPVCVPAPGGKDCEITTPQTHNFCNPEIMDNCEDGIPVLKNSASSNRGSRFFETKTPHTAAFQLLHNLFSISVDSAVTTGTILLIHDIMLARGYSTNAASWGAYLVNLSFSMLRLINLVLKGASWCALLFPTIISNIAHCLLTQTGLTSTRTTSWCTNALSIALSLYSGAGFFGAVANFGISSLVSYLASLGEKTFADSYLTSQLKLRCQQLKLAYCEICTKINGSAVDKLGINILALEQKVLTNPKMSDYALVCQYEEAIESKGSGLIMQ